MRSTLPDLFKYHHPRSATCIINKITVWCLLEKTKYIGISLKHHLTEKIHANLVLLTKREVVFSCVVYFGEDSDLRHLLKLLMLKPLTATKYGT